MLKFSIDRCTRRGVPCLGAPRPLGFHRIVKEEHDPVARSASSRPERWTEPLRSIDRVLPSIVTKRSRRKAGRKQTIGGRQPEIVAERLASLPCRCASVRRNGRPPSEGHREARTPREGGPV